MIIAMAMFKKTNASIFTKLYFKLVPGIDDLFFFGCKLFYRWLCYSALFRFCYSYISWTRAWIFIKLQILITLDKNWSWFIFGVHCQTSDALVHFLKYFHISSISETYARILPKLQFQLEADISWCWLAFSVNLSTSGTAILHFHKVLTYMR